MNELGLPIREFLSFDREKVEDFVSSLESGLPETRKEASTETSRQVNVGVNYVVQAQRKGGTHEVSWEEIRRATPASLFERLYQRLTESNAIETLSPFQEDNWHQLQVGGFIEVQSRVEFSALEMLFDVIRGWAPILDKLGFKQEFGPEWEKIVTYLFSLENLRNTYNIRITPNGASGNYVFVALLPKDKLRASKEELIGNYYVFGRIQRKLQQNESFPLVDLFPGIKMPIAETQQLLTGLQTMPQMFGPPPKKNDLFAFYPTIILTPVAIYR